MNGQGKPAQVAWSTPLPLNKTVLTAGEPPATLSEAEKERRAKCEATVLEGWNTFVEVGLALAEIRDSRLYRDTYESFDAYCQVKWPFERAQAYRLIDAAKTLEGLSPNGDAPLPKGIPLPTHEAQLRPLVRLSPKEARGFWVQAVEKANGGRVTARLVQAQITPPGTSGKKGRLVARKSATKSESTKKDILLALHKIERLVVSTGVAAKCQALTAKVRQWILSIP